MIDEVQQKEWGELAPRLGLRPISGISPHSFYKIISENKMD
jgi:hypothetical protein